MESDAEDLARVAQRSISRLREAEHSARRGRWDVAHQMIRATVDELAAVLQAIEDAEPGEAVPVSSRLVRRGQSEMRARVVEALEAAGMEAAAQVARDVDCDAPTPER